MAGRGTDIKLGGIEEDASYEQNKKIALEVGGLFIIEQNDTNLEELITNSEEDQEGR